MRPKTYGEMTNDERAAEYRNGPARYPATVIPDLDLSIVTFGYDAAARKTVRFIGAFLGATDEGWTIRSEVDGETRTIPTEMIDDWNVRNPGTLYGGAR